MATKEKKRIITVYPNHKGFGLSKVRASEFLKILGEKFDDLQDVLEHEPIEDSMEPFYRAHKKDFFLNFISLCEVLYFWSDIYNYCDELEHPYRFESENLFYPEDIIFSNIMNIVDIRLMNKRAPKNSKKSLNSPMVMTVVPNKPANKTYLLEDVDEKKPALKTLYYDSYEQFWVDDMKKVSPYSETLNFNPDEHQRRIQNI